MSAVIEEDSRDPYTMLQSCTKLIPMQNSSKKITNESDRMEVLMRQIVESNDNLNMESEIILSQSHVSPTKNGLKTLKASNDDGSFVRLIE